MSPAPPASRDACALLAERVIRAAGAVTGLDLAPRDALLRPGSTRHGADLQANLAMSLAKRIGRELRALAGEIVAALDVEGLAAPPQVAGPGFIQLPRRRRLDRRRAGGDRLRSAGRVAQRLVIDYSAPNIAKEMHVGHPRSIVVGDALARILRLAGDEVSAQNHVGDWGTQFGMLIEELDAGGWSADGADGGNGSSYLYETATAFSAFYEGCPILQAGDDMLRSSRLALTRHTAAVLRTGLDLLGIEAPAQL